MREILDALVEETGEALARRIREGSDQLIVEAIRQQVGAPRQAVAVAVADITPFTQLLAQALLDVADADTTDALPPPTT